MGTFVFFNELLTSKILSVILCISTIYFFSEGVDTCHRTVGLIRINTLNMRPPIFTVVYKINWCIITVTLIYTWINDLMEDLCSTRKIFDWCGIQNKDDIFFLLYCTNKSSFQNFLWWPFRDSSMFFGVIGLSRIWTSRCETTGINWSNIDQIPSISFL